MGKSKAFRKSFLSINSRLRVFILVLFIQISILPTPSKAGVFDPAYANPLFNCTTGTGCCLQVINLVKDMFEGVGLYAGQQDLQQFYYTNDLKPKIEEALEKLSDEVRDSFLFPVGPTGAFIDAQTLNQTLTALGKQSSETLVTQTPSNQICRFGTLSKSLAQSSDRVRTVQLGLATAMIQREVMRDGLASSFEKTVGTKQGRTSDKLSRFDEFARFYCDPAGSNGALSAANSWCTSASDARLNRDIDVSKSFYSPLTLNLDFTPGQVENATIDEQNLIALASNLFEHDLPVNFSVDDFKTIVTGDGDVADRRKEKLADYRSLVAKRSVAQNSFAALAALKSSGAAASSSYVKQIVEELGLDAAGQSALLGAHPSYYAQMEILTRKLYQSPQFYANLMDSNANIARQQVAMEGIAMMQDRDIYESLRRSEMVLSTLLETYIAQEQDAVKDRGVK